MENYPSNSRRAQPEPEKKADKQDKKIERVVSGEVVRRKKPLGKRLTETFIGGDAQGVGGYILHDVLIPAAKDMISDAVSQGIERMLFGDVRGRRGSSSPRSSSHTSYNRISTGGGISRREEPRREISQRGRATHDFDEIVIPTRAEAQEVIDRLFDIVSQFDLATVSDLYELVGQSGNFTDERWGWTDLRGAGVERVKGGYLLNLPRPEAIN